MKKSRVIKAAIAAVLIAAIALPSVFTFAANTVKNIAVTYRDIKLYVDGALVTPKDAAGNVVEPFIYNGTTYLPVRAVAEALGKDVDWNGETNSVYIGQPLEPDEITEVTVSSADELIAALGSNRRILLEEGVYNLTGVDTSLAYSPSVHFDDDIDGYQLRLDNIHNLTIEGKGDTQSEIIIEPRYAFVLKFQNSTNITITNIKAGHTVGGYCTGGVFAFDNCAGVNINNTLMYGCGTYGLCLYEVSDMTVTDSTIYECTYGILTAFSCRSIRFENCVFRDNETFAAVEISHTTDLSFNNCEFLRNIAQYDDYAMLYVAQSEDVTVTNTKFEGNQAARLVGPQDIDFGTTNTFVNNSFDE